jgi:TfdA family taurine catabolism dioxygenase TauD
MRDVSELPHVDLQDPHCGTDIVSALATHGIAIFHHAIDRQHLVRTARSLITIRAHRDADADGVTTIAQRRTLSTRTSTTGFTDRELWPHTEGSAVDPPPRILIVCCARPAERGGRVHLIDGSDLYQQISGSNPAMLTALAAPRSAFFGGGSGHLGAIFEKADEDRIVIRLRFDDLIRFSPTVAPFIVPLRGLTQSHVVTYNPGEGDGYILLNDRWLHGRTSFFGDRRMMRLIGDPLNSNDIPRGFPAPAHHQAALPADCLPLRTQSTAAASS